MDLKSTPKLLVLIFFIGLLAIGLTSCKLPASSGPQTTSQTENFPVPGETQSGINVSTFATQTAQAAFPIVLNTPTPGQNPTNTPPGAIVNTPFNTPTLPVPAAPVPSSTPTAGPTTIQYVTATAGPPPSTYVLLAGEYPFCIARRFNVNQSELVEDDGHHDRHEQLEEPLDPQMDDPEPPGVHHGEMGFTCEKHRR